MIEKAKIKQLNFVDIKEKESKIKYCSLKEVYDKIFPLFSEIYNLSKAYDSRSKLAEDENYINIRIEIGEILHNLRNSHKINGFSDSDYEFLNELLDKWSKLTKYFPVFGGDVSRLYLFWFLSYIDILENVFYSDVKIISFVDLFFFEKILDYILSEKGEAEAEKENLFRVFERFKPPIDHYRALTLILSHLKIKNDEIKNKLFEFYDSLIPKLKNKVNYSNLLLTKANHLIKQEDYKKAFELLEKNKNLILKEKPIEWISKIAQIKREDYEKGEKIRDNFNKFEYVKSLFLNVSNEYKLEFSLLILSEIKIDSFHVKCYIYETGFGKEVKDLLTPKILTLYIRALIKQEEYKKIKEELLFLLLNNYKLFAPTEFLNTLFLIYWELGIDEKMVKQNIDDEIIEHLISALEMVSPSDFSSFLFVWGLINEKGLKEKDVKLFLNVLKNKKTNDFKYLDQEKELLFSYIENIRDSVVKKKEIKVEKENFESYFFSEFAGDLMENDIKKFYREGSNELLDLNYFLYIDEPSKNEVKTGGFKLRTSLSVEQKRQFYLPFLKNKTIDFFIDKDKVFIGDRGNACCPWIASIYCLNTITEEVERIKSKIYVEKGLFSISYDKINKNLYYYDMESKIVNVYKYNVITKEEKKIFYLKGVDYPGKIIYKNGRIYMVDYFNSIIYIFSKNGEMIKKYKIKELKFPENFDIFDDKLIIGFRKCRKDPCIAIVNLKNDKIQTLKLKKNSYFVYSFCFLNKNDYLFSENNKIYFFDKNKNISKFKIGKRNNTLLRIGCDYNKDLYIYEHTKRLFSIYKITC